MGLPNSALERSFQTPIESVLESSSVYEFGQALPEEFFDWLGKIARYGWGLWFEAS